MMIRNHPILNRPLTITTATGRSFTADTYTGAAPKDSVEVTEHAVEDGTKIHDHAHVMPPELSVTVYLAGSPLESTRRALGPVAYLDAYELLLTILREREFCTVSWGLRVMTSMILTSVSPTQERGNVVTCELTFKTVQIARQRLVTVTGAATTGTRGQQSARGGSARSSKGRQPGKAATDDDAAKKAADEKWLADQKAAEDEFFTVEQEVDTSGAKGNPAPSPPPEQSELAKDLDYLWR